ncbi:MAG: ubiquinone biosynthesis protein UbiB [Deltaproteobacteria bacterium]|jgi:ubiquinone biosynthesis protein|uniref:ABC1 kinase family protein n=1 Tax=Hydrosulfovibrio ferrireducens TaxID=2934181 RepID=UPI00122A494F|nr:MAG: ubiquinone biosynthesis protein UbiB [Deltaproteobacteria bacterium]
MPSVLWETLTAARDLGRLHDIASILVRYGFSDMVRRLGMASALERAGKMLHWQEAGELARLEPPARVRRALEEMGPTFIKLGQILATRMDLFSPEWIAEFEKLQDRAPSVPFVQIRQQLLEDLGTVPEEVFAELVPEPLAAASIAQVHSARLRGGENVIVKVRRPGIRPIVEADLRLLLRLAKIVEAESPEMFRFRPREVVRQFTLSLRRELDLAAECRNAERIAHNFSLHDEIVIPKVYWTWTGERMNVQETISGIPGRDLTAVGQAGLNRKILAQRGVQAVLKMILVDGFFHADPHQGNIFYLPENRIAIIDFGMVGRLSVDRRSQVVDLLHGMVEREADRVVEVLLDWAGEAKIDLDSLKLEIDGLVDQYHGVPLKELNISTILTDLTTLLRDYHLILPPDLTLLIKSLITLEGMGRQLDPEFDMVTEFSPFLRRALQARYAPDALVKRGWQAVVDGLDILTGLPQDLRQLLRSARSGRLQVHVDVTRLQDFGDQLDCATSRLTMGVVIAALIIGSAIVMTVERGPVLFGLPLFGLLGFISAAVAGIWLLISIRRSGRNF